MISVSNLSKKFDAVQALKGISFDIKEGEFYGLSDLMVQGKQLLYPSLVPSSNQTRAA